MATVYKVLGQSAPAATTNTNIYTVPSVTSTVISTITVCNLTTVDATYRIAIRPAGATLSNQHYIAYDVTVRGSDSTNLTLGIGLATTDVVTVYSSSGTVSFSVFGTEIS